MQIGVIGLGRMGGNITRRLIQNGHEAVVYDQDPKAVAALSRDGASLSRSTRLFARMNWRNSSRPWRQWRKSASMP